MAFITAIAHLPDGNNVSYMDTGPLEDTSAYTSVIMLHGNGLNGHVFEPLHELAHGYHLRIFAINRRGYADSSEYSAAELDDLREGKPVFLDQMAVLLGHLIEYLIETHGLPALNADRSEGGIILLGWSLGCATVIPFISNGQLFQPKQYEHLRRYVAKLVLYDPPYTAFGFDGPSGRGTPPIMLGQNLKEHYEKFKELVGSYFDNSPDRDGDAAKPTFRLSNKRNTTESWSPEMWQKIFEPRPAEVLEWPLATGPIQDGLRGLTERALFDEASVMATFPDVEILHIVCWKSVRTTLWAYHCMKVAYEDRIATGQFVRPLSFRVEKDANHFWHWDHPRDFLQCLADAVQG